MSEDVSEYVTGVRMAVRGAGAFVDLVYPRAEGHAKFVEVGLEDVRAADPIRIVYDFARDGWSIMQQSYVDHGGCSEPLGDWAEVAFVEAWARETEHGR